VRGPGNKPVWTRFPVLTVFDAGAQRRCINSSMKTNFPRATPLVIIIAVAALFFSAAGGAVAGGLITGAKIKDNTVTTADIKNGTLKTLDMSAAAKAALQGNTGPAGAAGVDGTNGVSGYVRIVNTGTPVGAINTSIGAVCPVGKKLVGATSEFVGGYEGTSIASSETGATAYGTNIGADDSLRIVIYCVSAL
jgi:hypothetical protein